MWLTRYLVYANTASIIASISTSTYTICVNLMYGWGSEIAIYKSFDLIQNYLIFDTVVNIKKYVRTDHATLLHHACTYMGIAAGESLLQCVTGTELTRFYCFIWWALLGEASTLFNGIRILLRNTSYAFLSNCMFALAFMLFRIPMTAGMLNTVLQLLNDNKTHYNYRYTMSAFALCMGYLNIHWGWLIARKVRLLTNKRCLSD